MAKKKTRKDRETVPDQNEGHMFSAASFAGVVSQYSGGKWVEPEQMEPASPAVVAFYGFRGGAGRTTALAHVAALMASRQVQVVAIDLDIEAPGLHHVLDCPNVEQGNGAVELLRIAAVNDKPDAFRLNSHVVKSRLDIGTPIRVIPAGPLSMRYLDQIEDLGTPLWHLMDSPSPLEVLIREVKSQLSPQMICLDCRTGLSGLSASAIFHVADVIVCFLPMSGQSLDGFNIFLKGLKAAKLKRRGNPHVLIVPSMIPEGPEGRERLNNWFLPTLESCYSHVVLGTTLTEDNSEELVEQIPLIREGIEYRRGIALAGHLRTDFAQLSGGVYQPLLQQMERIVGLNRPSTKVGVNVKKVLDELYTKADLKNLAFAENTSPEDIVKKFIQPSDFKAIIDRTTWYVTGAKGAGKTWFWTYLQSDACSNLSFEMKYVAVHGPKCELFSASALRELECNKKVKMKSRSLHRTFWLLYIAKRLMTKYPSLGELVIKHFSGQERKYSQSLLDGTEETIQEDFVRILQYERVGTLSERLIRVFDSELLKATNLPSTTLLFDGLDVSFGSDEKSIQMRGRFVNALIEAIEPFRGATKRIFFKIFLREDIFVELSIQNQSHLAAATTELRWEPRDIWGLALNLVSVSPQLFSAMNAIEPLQIGIWPPEDERRQRLLEPLWGAQMEAGNKVSTAGFVRRRAADGKDRLFPRTLVQILAAAVDYQKNNEMRSDRVLRSAAIQIGYKHASEQRVADLRKEYDSLGPYLDGLKGMTPTGTENQIISYIQKKIRGKTKSRGAVAGALHAGPGGWHKVIANLLEIGVIREYRRARGENGAAKYEIALLYRPGLGIKAFGV